MRRGMPSFLVSRCVLAGSRLELRSELSPGSFTTYQPSIALRNLAIAGALAGRASRAAARDIDAIIARRYAATYNSSLINAEVIGDEPERLLAFVAGVHDRRLGAGRG